MLPAGLSYSFMPQLTPDRDLVVTYVLTNATGLTYTNVRFFFLLDAEIEQEVNTFFNEYGVAEGVAGLGASDVFADQWQIDEPGFAGGQLFANLYAGGLNNSNAIPAGTSNDVALALGFFVGDLLPGNSVGVAVEVSGRGNSLGPFRLVQRDAAAGSSNAVTLSGLVATLAGTIFQDLNRNGTPEAGEGVAGVTLRLVDGTNAVSQALTDASGNYSFSTPPPGTYTLVVDAGSPNLAGLANTVDPDGVLDSATLVTLVPGVLNLKNWGYQLSKLEGTVFRDVNRNDVPEAGEGLAGVTLRLLSGTNGVLAVATDANGYYVFNAPPAGTYVLVVDTNTLPPGLNNTVDPDGTLDGATAVTLAPGALVARTWGYQSVVVGGAANVTALAGLNFQWRLNHPTGWLIGTLTITNLPGGSASFGAPFQLGLPASTNYWLARPAGTLPDGVPYVELTPAVEAVLGAGGVLAPGQTVTVDGVEVYSRDRSAPPRNLFELWATQQ
jgi:hypothetical protein